MQRPTHKDLSSFSSLALLLGLLCTVVACGGPSTDDKTTPETTAPEATSQAAEPAQFSDGFESGDTTGWGYGKDAETPADDKGPKDTKKSKKATADGDGATGDGATGTTPDEG